MGVGPWMKYQVRAPEEVETERAPAGGSMKPWERYAAKNPAGKYAKAAAPAAAPGVAPPSDATSAAAEGFGQGATLGYLPQLQAAFGKMLPNPTADLDEELKKQGFDLHQKEDTYTSLRDENIARQESLKRSNPYTYNIAQLAGGVSTAPLLEAGVAGVIGKGASTARRAVATGATMGAIQNPGDEKGVVHNPLEGDFQSGSRAINAGTNALLGYGVSKVADKVGNLASNLKNTGEGLQTTAEDIALRQAGGQRGSLNKINRAYRNPEKSREVGRFIIDNDIAPNGAAPEDMLAKTQGLKNEAWNKMKAVYNAIDASGNAGRFDRKEVASALRDSLGEVGELRNIPGAPGASARQSLENLINEFEQASGPAGLDEIRSLKTMYGDNAGYNKVTAPPVAEGFRSLERSLGEVIDARANNLSNKVRGDLGTSLKEANRQYHMAHLADNLVKDKLAMQGNNHFSLSDRMAGGIGGGLALMHGGGMEAVPAALASAMAMRGARTYGPGVARAAADRTGDFLVGAGKMLEGPALPAAGSALEFMAPAAAAQLQREVVNPYSMRKKK